MRARGYGRRSNGISMADNTEHITCQEVVDLVSDYIEAALPGDQAALFEQHLNFCDGCMNYVEQLRTTVASVGALREEAVPDDVKAQLLATFRDWRHT